jgi:PPK2 family polyphosphate:nucleotide phosphotransferase
MSRRGGGLSALEHWRVEAGVRLRLDDYDPAAHPASSGDRHRDEARMEALGARLGELQARLYAGKRHAFLLVLQGMDTSGKDGVIRRVFAHVSPLGVRARGFGVPAGVECEHDFLWRIHASVPARGELAVFNRSHYEDVLAARVRKLVDGRRIQRRFEHLRAFEAMLVDEGTVVLKCFLHISRREQGARLCERLEDASKRWKLQASDLEDRRHWPAYRRAYEEALSATSSAEAPWYIVPADSRFQRDLMVAELLVARLEQLRLRYPEGELPGDARVP